MEQPVLPPEARVLNLLDVLPDGFIPLSRVTSREDGRQANQFLDRAPRSGKGYQGQL